MTLLLPTAQGGISTSIHEKAGFLPNQDYGFRDPTNTQFDNTLDFLNGDSQKSFRYHDKMSSYSGPSPAANTGEDGRPGTWEIRAERSGWASAIHQLAVDPRPTGKVAFDNPPRTLLAGKPVDSFSTPQAFVVQLQDQFGNPTVATTTIVVALSSDTRQASSAFDTVQFSTSSISLDGPPPAFTLSTSTLTLSLNTFGATFYYLDTTASSAYAVQVPTRPIIRAAVPDRPWTPDTESVFVEAASIGAIAFLGGMGQPLEAGATSQAFTFQTRDQFGNPSNILAEDSPGQGVAFRLTSN